MQSWPRRLFHAHHGERLYNTENDVPTDREGWTDTPDKVGNPEKPKAIEWLEGRARADDESVLAVEQGRCPIWGTFAEHARNAAANNEEGDEYRRSVLCDFYTAAPGSTTRTPARWPAAAPWRRR